jgi:hypothetical protein
VKKYAGLRILSDSRAPEASRWRCSVPRWCRCMCCVW